MRMMGEYPQRVGSLMTLFMQHTSMLSHRESIPFYHIDYFPFNLLNFSSKPDVPSCSCRDCLHALYCNWQEQIPILADEYLCWKHQPTEQPGSESPSHVFTVSAVETSSMYPNSFS